MTSSISASVIAWLPSASWYDGSPDGDQFGAKELSASPCWPTWYSCWIITTSGLASRQASVRRRKRGHDGVVVVAEVAPRQHRGPVDRHGLHDDHPGTTERPLPVVADVPLAGQPALGHVRGVRPEVDPARQGPVAQLREARTRAGRASLVQYGQMADAPPLVVVAGATATGKTELGIRLAEAFLAEGRPATVISADSRQVYRGLDIGTAKVSAADRARVPHAGLDLVDPPERFALADFVGHARGVLAEVAARDGVALLVGGTGLYLRAVARGIDLDALPDDPDLRARLEAEFAADGLPPLVERLDATAPTLAAQTDTANPRRVLRALEIAELRGDGPRPAPRGYDGPVTWIGLTAGPRRSTSAASRPGPAQQFDDGLVEEAVALRERYDPGLPAFSAIGYHEAWDVADGRTHARGGRGDRRETQRRIREAPANLVPQRARHRLARRLDDEPFDHALALAWPGDRLVDQSRVSSAVGELGLVDDLLDTGHPLDHRRDVVAVVDVVHDPAHHHGRAAGPDDEPVRQVGRGGVRLEGVADPGRQIRLVRQQLRLVVLVLWLGERGDGRPGRDLDPARLLLVRTGRRI